jgi:hypothetical protein
MFQHNQLILSTVFPASVDSTAQEWIQSASKTCADALHERSKVRELELVKFPTVPPAKVSENKHWEYLRDGALLHQLIGLGAPALLLYTTQLREVLCLQIFYTDGYILDAASERQKVINLITDQ